MYRYIISFGALSKCSVSSSEVGHLVKVSDDMFPKCYIRYLIELFNDLSQTIGSDSDSFGPNKVI